MDRVKAQAEQALVKAQQGMTQAQARLDPILSGNGIGNGIGNGNQPGLGERDALLRNLGAAYYAQQRAGGSADAVDTALAALDAHAATPAAPAQPAPQQQPPVGGGSFSLDDI